MPPITIKSVKLGFLFILSLNFETLFFNSSIAEVSAFNQLLIILRLPIPINNKAIQMFAITISTNTIPP